MVAAYVRIHTYLLLQTMNITGPTPRKFRGTEKTETLMIGEDGSGAHSGAKIQVRASQKRGEYKEVLNSGRT